MNPVRAIAARAAQAIRAAADIAAYNALIAEKEALRLESFSGDITNAGIKGNSHFDFLSTYLLNSQNLATFKTAIDAQSCKVVYLGHSIAEGQNQNWLGSSLYSVLRNSLKNAFSDVDFSFVNLGLGGRKATQYGSAANILDNTGYVGKVNETYASTGFYRGAKSSSYFAESWISRSGSPTNGSTLNKSWRNHVLAESPDLVFVQFDLNDQDVADFTAAMQFIIDDFKLHGDWSAKRPSVVLISSHTGLSVSGTPINPALVRDFAVILRELSRVNGVPLIDGGRVYDILTTGYDPVVKDVQGEAFFKYDGTYNSAASFLLNASYWQNVLGTGYSPTGSTIRDQASGQLVALRKRSVRDCTVAGVYTSYSASSEARVFYRADPADTSNTAKRYEVKIVGSTLSLIFQDTGGVQTVIATATVTAISGSSSHHIKVDVRGARHTITVNGVEKINVDDFSLISVGWCGVGVKNSGAWLKGTNLTNGFFIEFHDDLYIEKPRYTDVELLGVTNDFATNAESAGGNAVNHLTSIGHQLVYAPVVANVVRQIQAKM